MSENRNTSPDRVASGDIVERIRSLRYVHVPVASQVMAEAADEIERLRNGATCPHVRGTVTQYCSLNFTLADEEREAIEIAAAVLDDEYYGTNCKKELAAVATLRKLLERLHT
jgi:hypothetical protein